MAISLVRVEGDIAMRGRARFEAAWIYPSDCRDFCGRRVVVGSDYSTSSSRQAVILLYRFNDFVLDTGRRELRCGNSMVATEPQVFDLLEYLVRSRERVVSRDDILAAV